MSTEEILAKIARTGYAEINLPRIGRVEISAAGKPVNGIIPVRIGWNEGKKQQEETRTDGPKAIGSLIVMAK